MNLDVAQSVVQLEKQKTETMVAAASAVADLPVDHEKCSQLYARLAEKKPRFRSNRLRIDLFIAENAMYPQHVTIIKSFMRKTFLPGL